jgi:Antitoxin VbhA
VPWLVSERRYRSLGALNEPVEVSRPAIVIRRAGDCRAPEVGKLRSLGHLALRSPAVEPPSDGTFVDYSEGTRQKEVAGQVTELKKVKRRFKAVRAIRRSTEREGSSSPAATRADQVASARGHITVTELGDRVRRRYSVQ